MRKRLSDLNSVKDNLQRLDEKNSIIGVLLCFYERKIIPHIESARGAIIRKEDNFQSGRSNNAPRLHFDWQFTECLMLFLRQFEAC